MPAPPSDLLEPPAIRSLKPAAAPAAHQPDRDRDIAKDAQHSKAEKEQGVK